MVFYLRIINPVISLLVFILCTWAAICGDNNEIHFYGIVSGTFSTYFFAKGLFTGSSLFILGKILLEVLKKGAGQSKPSKREVFYSFAFLCFSVGALAGLYFWGVSPAPAKEAAAVTNPPGLNVVESCRIKESSAFKLLVKIRNSSGVDWASGKVVADLFIKGKYSGQEIASLPGVKPNEELSVFIDFDDFLNANVPDPVSYRFKIEMAKPGG